MNISQLQVLLQESIDRATSTMEYLELSKAIQALNMGQIRKISSLENLPSANTNEGLLVFVESEETLYWSTGSSWEIITGIGGNTFSAYSWGANIIGGVGDGTTVNRSSPVSVLGGFTDWCQVSAGNRASLGVRQDGTAWAWGLNIDGRLGDETTTHRSSPVSVVGGFTDWCQVSAGYAHSLGVRQNGTVWAWGLDTCGRLGTGTLATTSSPVSVVGGFTDWCQVSAGSCHSLGVRQNGTAWAWGRGSVGEIGDGTTVNRSSPVSVVGGFTDWCQVSAGSSHSLGVRQNGTAWAWGLGTCGRLGSGTTIDRSSPVSVVGGFTDWCQVSASNIHSVGIKSDGTVWAWATNLYGRLGDGTTVNRSSPVSVVGGFTDWCQISAGSFHSIALKRS